MTTATIEHRPAMLPHYTICGDGPTAVPYESWVEAAAAAQRRNIHVRGLDAGQEAVKYHDAQPECWLVRLVITSPNGRVTTDTTRFHSEGEAQAFAERWSG